MYKAAMNGKIKAGALGIALVAVGFVAGWLVASVQNVGKLDLGEITANRWMGDLGLLVGNVRSLKPIAPSTTQAMIRQGLDIDSITLAQLYDGMSPALQKRLAFYIPMARAIAVAQPATGLGIQDRHALLILADCMQKIRSQGGLVRKCFEDQRRGIKSKRVVEKP